MSRWAQENIPSFDGLQFGFSCALAVRRMARMPNSLCAVAIASARVSKRDVLGGVENKTLESEQHEK